MDLSLAEEDVCTILNLHGCFHGHLNQKWNGWLHVYQKGKGNSYQLQAKFYIHN